MRGGQNKINKSKIKNLNQPTTQLIIRGMPLYKNRSEVNKSKLKISSCPYFSFSNFSDFKKGRDNDRGLPPEIKFSLT